MSSEAKLIAVAVIENDGRFLVGKRASGKPVAGRAEFPGGHVDEGETAEQAVVRETFEETGLSVSVVRRYLEKSHTYPHGELRLIFFKCQLTSVNETPRPPFAWVPRETMLTMRFPEANRELLHILATEGTIEVRRLVPEIALPPYSYVTGKFPHPTRDPAGHSHCNQPPPIRKETSSTAWPECTAYLRGIDLFNHGYYWEAHEAWEEAWHSVGRQGQAADFFKGLIKLAAAFVKGREGRAAGVVRHARRADELLTSVLDANQGDPHFMGLSLDELCRHARRVSEQPERFVNTSDAPVVRLADFTLAPQ